MTTQVINFANLLIKKLLRRYLRSKVSFEGLLWLLYVIVAFFMHLEHRKKKEKVKKPHGN